MSDMYYKIINKVKHSYKSFLLILQVLWTGAANDEGLSQGVRIWGETNLGANHSTINQDDFGMCGDFGHMFYAIKECFWEKKGA